MFMFTIIGQPTHELDPERRKAIQRVMDYWGDPALDLDEKIGRFKEAITKRNGPAQKIPFKDQYRYPLRLR
jgi:hypothetical protein